MRITRVQYLPPVACSKAILRLADFPQEANPPKNPLQDYLCQ